MARELSAEGEPAIVTNWQISSSDYNCVRFGVTRQHAIQDERLKKSKENGMLIRGHVYQSPPTYENTYHVDICMSESASNCLKCSIDPVDCPIKGKLIKKVKQ